MPHLIGGQLGAGIERLHQLATAPGLFAPILLLPAAGGLTRQEDVRDMVVWQGRLSSEWR
jgi:hypothetical protein